MKKLMLLYLQVVITCVNLDLVNSLRTKRSQPPEPMQHNPQPYPAQHHNPAPQPHAPGQIPQQQQPQHAPGQIAQQHYAGHNPNPHEGMQQQQHYPPVAHGPPPPQQQPPPHPYNMHQQPPAENRDEYPPAVIQAAQDEADRMNLKIADDIEEILSDEEFTATVADGIIDKIDRDYNVAVSAERSGSQNVFAGKYLFTTLLLVNLLFI